MMSNTAPADPMAELNVWISGRALPREKLPIMIEKKTLRHHRRGGEGKEGEKGGEGKEGRGGKRREEVIGMICKGTSQPHSNLQSRHRQVPDRTR